MLFFIISSPFNHYKRPIFCYYMVYSKNNFNLVLLHDLFQNQFNWYKIQDTQKRWRDLNFHMWQFPKWDTNTFAW